MTILTIDSLIKTQSEKFPHKIAIKYRGQTITYYELYKSSNQFANFLIQKNITSGDIIGMAMNRSIQMVISILACLKMGVAYIPIGIDNPKDRVDYLLQNTGAKALLTSEQHEKEFEAVERKFLFEDFGRDKETYSSEISTFENLENSLAYILHTSGSTGMPKGVEILQKNLLNFLLSMQVEPGISPEDIVLSITTISFDIAQLEIFLPLISGAKLYIEDLETTRDGRLLLETIKNEKISIVQGTPFTWRMMLEFGWDKKLPIKALIGGEALSKELAEKLVERCNELWNMYGPTETTVWSLIKKISSEDKIITIGKPIRNTQVYLLNEKLNEVPSGEIGEIYIGGDGVGRGYNNRPELTIKAFLNDPFIVTPGNKIYKTGDLGKMLDNGEIQCLGRIDHQIKIRGFRIETEEIEFQIKKQEHVKEVIVIAHKDSFENLRLVAYIVTKERVNVEQSQEYIHLWKSELKLILTDYMIPSVFMIISEIPLMSNGKVNRKALPEPTTRSSGLIYEKPETDMQKFLITAWENEIGIKEISTTDDFFELGGTSLIATKIMIQIEKFTGKRLPITTIFKYPQIKQLATFTEEYSSENANSIIVPFKESGTKFPLYIIHGIGLNVLNIRFLASKMDADQPVLGVQSIGLDGTNIDDIISFEDIASIYVKEITQHNPTGPYLIIGYSFGGFIAFEIARQLKEMGKEVALLGMIDTNLQKSTVRSTQLKKIYVKVIRQVYKLAFRINSFISNPTKDIHYLKMYYRERNSKDSRLVFGEIMPDFMIQISRKLQKAKSNYLFKPFDITIDLFKSKERFYFVDDHIYFGWKELALKGVNLYITQGDHKDMMQNPNVENLAKQMQNRIDEINMIYKKP